MSNSTLAYCQKVDRRYEADTNSESECPYCRALAAEARAAQAESELDNSGSAYVAMAYKVAELQRVVSEVVAERDEARMELQQIRTMLDNGTDETAIEMVKRLNAELYDSRQEYAHDPRVPIEIRDPRWSDDGT